MEYLSEIDCFIHAQGTKEGKSPCGLSITATDFYVYVRYKCFCLYVYGRMERRQDINLVDYLVQYIFLWVCSVQSPSHVQLFATPWIEARQASLCGYVRDTEFSAYVEGKKEGDNLSRLSITTTDFCLYVSTDLLFHPWPVCFFFFFFNSLCLNLRVSFYIVKYFLWISLSLSLSFFFCL